MTWNRPSGPGSRAATLAASIGAALLTSGLLAPGAGAEAGAVTGAWTVQPSPSPQGALASGLAAVSCWSPGGCVAAGSSSYP